MAHQWAKWLRHPCRLGDPHRLRAGGGGDQKWPSCGQSGYVTPAVSGIPSASERGAKSELAGLWAKWLRHPCRLGDPHRLRAGGIIRSGPQVGKVAKSPLLSQGSPPLQSGGQNQRWPRCGQSGYVTPAASGIPTASGQDGKPRVANKWAKWLRHPCRLRHPLRFKAAAANQKWSTSGQSGYIAPAISRIPTASERGAKSDVAHLWAKWLRHPCHLGDPHRFRAGGKIRSGSIIGKVATSPLPSRGSPPLESGRGGGIRSGSSVGKVATSPLPSRGSPPLESGGGGGDQKWPSCGQSGYVTPAVSGIPSASERGAKSELAGLWAKWLRHPCRLGDPHRLRAGGIIRSGPQVGKVAKSPLLSQGSPPLQSGGQNQKWPRCGQSGYVTPAASGIPTASGQDGKPRVAHKWAKWLATPLPSQASPPLQSGGGKSEVVHKWAKWLHRPCHLEDPHRFRAGGKIRRGPLVGKVATSPLPSRGSPPL